MKIECILKREGGTKVDFPSISYHFKPDPKFDNRHIADVSNEDHIGRLLSIREAYVMVKTATDFPVEPPKNKPAEPVAPVAPAGPVGPGVPVAPVEPIEPVKQADPVETEAKTEAEPVVADGLDAMDRAALVEVYQNRFGSPPPARIGKQGLIAALREKADG